MKSFLFEHFIIMGYFFTSFNRQVKCEVIFLYHSLICIVVRSFVTTAEYHRQKGK